MLRDSSLLDPSTDATIDISPRAIGANPLGSNDGRGRAVNPVTGAVYPADLVAGSRVFEDWRLNPVMPLPEYAKDYRWRTFGLLLPLQAAGKEQQYLLTIRIEDVITA